MGRAIVGVIVGYAVWTAGWLGGNALFFGEMAEAVEAGEAYTEAGPLGAVLALSVGCSLVAGIVCALLTKKRGAVFLMALLLLATGIVVQMGFWSLMPVWYHVVFLVLLVPVTMFGGSLGGARTRARTR